MNVGMYEYRNSKRGFDAHIPIYLHSCLFRQVDYSLVKELHDDCLH
jgi:hypothetical protein